MFTRTTMFQAAAAFVLIAIWSPIALADEHASEVANLFERQDRDDGPGVAVGIARDGKVIMARGFGMANLEHGIPISGDTVFRMASVSKQFTAVCVAMLAEQGKLSVTDDIRKYIPEMPEFDTPVEVQHLLHHTSGYRDYLNLQGLAGFEGKYYYSAADTLDMLARQKNLNFDPGTDYLYSNSGYFLLGEIVARLSGQTLNEFATEQLFEPIGMSSAHFHDDTTRIVPNRADGYSRADGGWYIDMTQLDLVGDGALYTSVNEMLRWNDAIIQRRLGNEKSLLPDTIFDAPPLNDGSPTDYAYGLIIDEYRGLPTVGHGGSWVGFRTANLTFPEQGLSIVVLANLSSINPSKFCKNIADIYLKDVLEPESESTEGISTRGNGRNRDQTEFTVGSEKLPEFVGVYASAELNASYQISIEEDALVQTIVGMSVEPSALKPTEADQFRGGWGKAFQFTRDAEGSIDGFDLNSGRVRGLRFDRVDDLAATPR
jgi:CubicO group peptidase (beta-lactamase class C family)